MTVKIDSSEVLFYLNKYGIRSIDEDAFKQFIKDLKKLIKHEQRKKEAFERTDYPSQYPKNPVVASPQSGAGCNCDIQISSCCPEDHATVTYVHSPCKNQQKAGEVCRSHADGSVNDDVLPKDRARSPSSISYTRTRYKNRRRKVNDPVELYHYYQSIWKQHKLPGENDHAELRQAIRNRLNNCFNFSFISSSLGLRAHAVPTSYRQD